MNTITWFVVALNERQAVDIGRQASAFYPWHNFADGAATKPETVTDDEEEIAGMLFEARKRDPALKPFRVTFAEAASVIPDSCLK